MNKSQRIRTDIDFSGDKNLKVKLEQGVDTLEILSLKIDQRDLYQFFNCDYGVLIGRVNANGGVGIPNAKVSIFIPIDEEDEAREEIRAIYPYKSPRDQDADGKRYNLLPRVATEREDGTVKPNQPFGSFPTKEEFVTNETYLEVYEKYYKYSTVTNSSGDYMLFGVPVGVQTVHMSVDITDIGRFSMTPASLVSNLGYSPNLFTDNGTKIKPSNDLNDLPNIETQEISVEVIPFCGDSENFDIGITRQDFRIRAELISTFTIFGSSFTDEFNTMWGDESTGNKLIRQLYNGRNTLDLLAIDRKRTGGLQEQIFTLPASISDEDIENGNFSGSDFILLDRAEYTRQFRNGDFIYIVNCNRNRIVTNEQGEDVRVPDDSSVGAFTEFRGFVTFEMQDTEVLLGDSIEFGNRATLSPFRWKFKFPQNADRAQSFNVVDDTNDVLGQYTEDWRKQNFKFEFGKIYSVARFHGLVFNNANSDRDQDKVNGFVDPDRFNDLRRDVAFNTGVIQTNNVEGEYDNESQQMIPNRNIENDGRLLFGGNWLNFSIHFPQHGYLTGSGGPDTVRDHRSNTSFSQNFFDIDHFYVDNAQEIAGGVVNTKHFARSDFHYTTFVETPVEDLILIRDTFNNTKGFVQELEILNGDYANANTRPVPEDGGRLEGDPNNGIDPETYFYKGVNESDCIQFLFDLGIV